MNNVLMVTDFPHIRNLSVNAVSPFYKIDELWWHSRYIISAVGSLHNVNIINSITSGALFIYLFIFKIRLD